jgi:hypothetical protein
MAWSAEPPAFKIAQGKYAEDKSDAYILSGPRFALTVVPSKGGCIAMIQAVEEIPEPKNSWNADRVTHGKSFTEAFLGAQTVDFGAMPFEVASSEATAARLLFVLRAQDKATGLAVEKTIEMTPSENAFLLTQTFTNAGAQALKGRWVSRFAAEPQRWSAHSYLRLFAGGPVKMGELVTYRRDTTFPTKEVRPTDGAWFCCMNTYDKMTLARFLDSPKPLTFEMTSGMQPLTPDYKMPFARVAAQSDEMTLEPGKSLTFKSRVIVGCSITGLEGVTRDDLVYGADVPEFRPPKTRFSMYASAVSPRERQVEAVFRRKLGSAAAWDVIGKQKILLTPGMTGYARLHTDFPEGGAYTVSIVFMEGGKELATVERPIFIGDPKDAPAKLAETAKRWDLKMPEMRVSGTWPEIGEALAKAGRSGYAPKALAAAKTKWETASPALKERVARAQTYYASTLPQYPQLLEGLAKGLNVPVEQLLVADLPEPRPAPEKKGCFDLGILEGPDGPLAAWSNEDYALPEARCYYLNVKPRDGYAFHCMDSYGVNQKGLATGGANLGEHSMYTEKGRKMLDEWLAAGNFTVPLASAWRGNISWLLAKCATVPEALAFLTDPKNRVSFQGVMVIVDRNGDAAVFQSAWLLQVVRRPDSKLITCTNYPIPITKDGEFSFRGGGLYTNGVIRDQGVRRFLSQLPGPPGVEDLLALLTNRQEPGTICQNPYDNCAEYITTTSLMAQCRTSDLYLCWGNPWYTRFYRYPLNEEPLAKPADSV